MSEFDLIATYFTWDDFRNVSNPGNHSTQKTSNVIKSVGDDAAVLSLAPNQQLVTSIDTLVSGVHFPTNTKPFDIGHKALAVNISDLAAMGAKPEWFTLALTLPEINHEWLIEFSRGLKTLAEEVDIALVGGDTTSGPLSISIQVMGSVEAGKALYRSGAKQGDRIYVTGTLGNGALGLASIQNRVELTKDDAEFCEQRLNRPTSRLKESSVISDFASACIDVSDGLLQDLTHILKQSNLVHPELTLGAEINLSKIPLSEALKNIDKQQSLEFALTGGDDYELLFTIPEALETKFLEAAKVSGYGFSCIGVITNDNVIVDTNNNSLETKGFNHFS